MKAGRLQLIPRGHTGRLRQHKHTSYAGLGFLLLLTAVVVAVVSGGADGAAPAVNPQSGSVGLTGTVRGPAPSTAAVITSPRSGQRTSAIPIAITGICPQGTLVTIMKNGAFGGVAVCADDGTFNLQADLFDGRNVLVARVSDALGQFGPDSAAVEVFYDAPSFRQPAGAIGRQLFLETTTTVVAVAPGSSLSRSVTIVGGTGPYAVSWDWGDGANSLVSQAGEGPVSASHTYERPGNYRVLVHVTDSQGNAALLQLVTIVNGSIDAVGSTGSQRNDAAGYLLAVWPLLILAALMVAVFWLGERREHGKILKRLQQQGLY